MDFENTQGLKQENMPNDPQNTIKILIASDIHLGYLETDKERGNDSFITFEEILEKAVDQKVDMILLGGDLFHVNKPSPTTLKKCLESLRKYCVGDREVFIDVLSDPQLVMTRDNVNFLDPNLNISLPVFTINGNHDDPSGPELVAALDIVSNSGLVNYLGKCTNLNEITLHPLILQKNETKIAIYGMGYIKDERLVHMIKYNKVKYMKPADDKDIIYILVLHQNRPERGTAKNIGEDSIPNFFNFVVWGHEHECRIRPEFNTKQKFHVCQPGSPIATSLCAGESVKKEIGILSCLKTEYRLDPLSLETVRPFIFETLTIEPDAMTEKEEIEKTVEGMIENAKNQLKGNSKQPQLPLIRLRVENFKTDGLSDLNTIVFGQKYENKVANSNEILLIKNKKIKSEAQRAVNGGVIGDAEDDQNYINMCLDDLLKSYYTNLPADSQLHAFLPSEFNESVKRFVNQEDKSVFLDMINFKMESIMKHFEQINIKEEDIDMELSHFQTTVAENQGEEFKTFLEDVNRTQLSNTTYGNMLIGSDDEDTESLGDIVPVAKPARGRGSRGPRGPRNRGRAPRGRK